MEYTLNEEGKEGRILSIPGVETAEVKLESPPFDWDDEGYFRFPVETGVPDNCVGIGFPVFVAALNAAVEGVSFDIETVIPPRLFEY